MTRDDEPTQVTRTRPMSSAMRRASSSIIPRVTELAELPEGPEQEEALAKIFGDAIDLIAGPTKELVAVVKDQKGQIANLQQEKELLSKSIARIKAENARLREQLSAARGGR